MTLQERIDALPGWPERESDAAPFDVAEYSARNFKVAYAALARLALAKEVIADRIQIRDHDDWLAICALIEALDHPK